MFFKYQKKQWNVNGKKKDSFTKLEGTSEYASPIIQPSH